MKEAKEILALIESSQNIVITAHRSPDGDSIGSSLGMYHYIKSLGKSVEICHPDPCPSFLDWVKGDVEIYNFEDNEEDVIQKMHNADLIFCLDYNGSNRMGHGMGPLLDECTAKKVMIDHHPNPDDFVDIAVSETSVCSTCQLIYEFIEATNGADKVDAVMGAPIYLGIMTDTGSFRYSSVDSRTHEIVSKLINAGVKHTPIHEETFGNARLDQLKLRGFAISEKLEIIGHYHIAYISLTEDELQRFNYKKGDTDGLVNTALSVEGVKVALLFSEKDGQIKISFRSLGDIAVNEFAAAEFDGGGHRNAAGGVSNLSMEETLKKFKAAIPRYFAHINE